MVESFVVQGGKRIEGCMRVDSAKNAVLPLMAACVLTPEPVILTDVPDITDAAHMAEILQLLGCSVARAADQQRPAGRYGGVELPPKRGEQKVGQLHGSQHQTEHIVRQT